MQANARIFANTLCEVAFSQQIQFLVIKNLQFFVFHKSIPP